MEPPCRSSAPSAPVPSPTSPLPLRHCRSIADFTSIAPASTPSPRTFRAMETRSSSPSSDSSSRACPSPCPPSSLGPTSSPSYSLLLPSIGAGRFKLSIEGFIVWVVNSSPAVRFFLTLASRERRHPPPPHPALRRHHPPSPGSQHLAVMHAAVIAVGPATLGPASSHRRSLTVGSGAPAAPSGDSPPHLLAILPPSPTPLLGSTSPQKVLEAGADGAEEVEGVAKKLWHGMTDMPPLLDRCLHHLEWERSQEQVREKAEDEIEQERLQMAMIDWHDFVVVEIMEFADDEDEELLVPMTLEEVIRRSKMIKSRWREPATLLLSS